MSASPLTVAAHLAARGVPANQIAEEVFGHVKALVAAGALEARDGELIDTASGKSLDPDDPLPDLPEAIA